MVAFYIVTKGGHPFGEERHRLDNLLKGNPVDLDKVEDISTKDLITWMLSHNPRERPSAEEALKHPYLQSEEEKFEMLCSVGNQTEIKREDSRSDVVRMLNSNPDNWKALMERRYLKFLCNGKRYNSSWTSCLRLIRNVNQHWNDHPRPRPNVFDLIGDPQQYFLQLFPNLPVQVHKIIRTSDWRKRPELSKYFAQMKITYV
jgi:serine/threonine-protein kinase/endoribonuclease IRE1